MVQPVLFHFYEVNGIKTSHHCTQQCTIAGGKLHKFPTLFCNLAMQSTYMRRSFVSVNECTNRCKVINICIQHYMWMLINFWGLRDVNSQLAWCDNPLSVGMDGVRNVEINSVSTTSYFKQNRHWSVNPLVHLSNIHKALPALLERHADWDFIFYKFIRKSACFKCCGWPPFQLSFAIILLCLLPGPFKTVQQKHI